MTKRKTKTQMRDDARAHFLANHADALRARGHSQSMVDYMADSHADAVADQVRPTTAMRKRQKAEKEWAREAATGKPPALPKPPPLIKDACMTAFFGKRPPERTAKNADGTFTALVQLRGQLHKLCKLPTLEGARRVAAVARIAAWVTYQERVGLDGPGPDEFAATQCVSADYPLAFKRAAGRPTRSVLKAGQMSGVGSVTSGWVVKRVGDLLERTPPFLPEGDPMAASRALWGLREHGRASDEGTRRLVANEVAGWLKTIRERYRNAGLLNPATEAMLKARSKDYGRKLTGYSAADYDNYLEQQDEVAQALRETEPRRRGG